MNLNERQLPRQQQQHQTIKTVSDQKIIKRLKVFSVFFWEFGFVFSNNKFKPFFFYKLNEN